MRILCDVCNGELIVDAGGKTATCKECGMPHSIERVREKLWEAKEASVSDTPKARDLETPKTAPVISSPTSEDEEIYDAEFTEASEEEVYVAEFVEDSDSGENSPSYDELHEIISEYLRSGPFSSYEIVENVPASYFGANSKCMPINFLFKSGCKDVLAVAILKAPRRSHGAVTGTMDAVILSGITYVDFFVGLPNERSYVIKKISNALGM